MQSNDKLHFKILPPEQIKLLKNLTNEEWLKKFYLAGGTGLALQIEHRESIDLDFFTNLNFDYRDIIQKISNFGDFIGRTKDENTIHGQLNNVEISFFKIPYKLLEKPIDYKNLRLASLLDIGCMKLEAIAHRGTKKDFIDLYFLLKRFSLHELLLNCRKKYGTVENIYHIVRSLSYFEDAEKDDTKISMLVKVEWQKIKSNILQHVSKVNPANY